MQIFFFTYHKVGTALTAQIIDSLRSVLNWKPHFVLGFAKDSDVHEGVVQFCHSLIGFDLTKYPHRGIRLIRDPRDVWLSGYLYHLRCAEGWCLNDDFGTASPIMFPRVPYSQQTRSEQWKGRYLSELGGKSYQQNLKTLDFDSGLVFEMDRYADWTISAMMRWKADPDTIDIRLEAFSEDFDGTLSDVLRHCRVPERDLERALSAASVANIGKMSDLDIERNDHIVSRSISKWRTMLTPAQVQVFEERHADAIIRLGYTLSTDG